MVQRHHHGRRRGLRGDAVGQEEGRERRRAVGLAGHVGEAAHRFGQRAEARPVALRAPAAVAADVEHHDLGVRAGAPTRSPAPTRRARSGGCSPRRRRSPRAGGGTAPGRRRWRRSIVTHFLLRLMLFQKRPTPSFCSPQVRSGSPTPGCSTLITSAPNSPSIVATIGPAASVAASTTRRPRSGRSRVRLRHEPPRPGAPARGARARSCRCSAHGTRRGAGARARRAGPRPRRRRASASPR